MSWLDKYPPKNKPVKEAHWTTHLLIKLGFLLIFVVIIYWAFHYAITYISTKVSPMVVQTTGAAGSGLAATFLITKFLPFFIAFKAILKIIKTILTLLLLAGLFLLYLNIKHPEVFQSLAQSFS